MTKIIYVYYATFNLVITRDTLNFF